MKSRIDGKYIVFEMTEGGSFVLLNQQDYVGIAIGIGAGIVVSIGLLLLLRVKRKKAVNLNEVQKEQ